MSCKLNIKFYYDDSALPSVELLLLSMLSASLPFVCPDRAAAAFCQAGIPPLPIEKRPNGLAVSCRCSDEAGSTSCCVVDGVVVPFVLDWPFEEGTLLLAPVLEVLVVLPPTRLLSNVFKLRSSWPSSFKRSSAFFSCVFIALGIMS